jgi:hypothetical protein
MNLPRVFSMPMAFQNNLDVGIWESKELENADQNFSNPYGHPVRGLQNQSFHARRKNLQALEDKA